MGLSFSYLKNGVKQMKLTFIIFNQASLLRMKSWIDLIRAYREAALDSRLYNTLDEVRMIKEMGK